MNTPTLSIVVVGMNHLCYLKNLFKSLFEEYLPKTSFEVIYIDNCSSDGSVEYLKINYPQVIIYENEIIKGFGENNNYGASKANGKFLAIINPDIRVLDSSIDVLVEYLNNNKEIGIVVPQLLNPDMSIQYSVRTFISLNILFWRFIHKGDDSSSNRHTSKYLRKDMDVDKIQSVEWAIGAAMFMTKKHYNELNGFDQDYFLYMEDEDLCLRSWKMSKPVVYNPLSKMIHDHQRSSNKLNKKTWMHLKSMYTFFKKHGLNIKINKQ